MFDRDEMRDRIKKAKLLWDYYSLPCVFKGIATLIFFAGLIIGSRNCRTYMDLGFDSNPIIEAIILQTSVEEKPVSTRNGIFHDQTFTFLIRYEFEESKYQRPFILKNRALHPKSRKFEQGATIAIRVDPEEPKRIYFRWEDQKLIPKDSKESPLLPQ